MLLAMLESETTVWKCLLPAKGKVLVATCVSHIHVVESAADRLLMRERMLLSHRPNPEPSIVSIDAAVIAILDPNVRVLITLCAGKSALDVLNFAKSLFPSVSTMA